MTGWSFPHLGAGMWRALFVEQIPLTEKILRTVLVYG
jgi:hypothetical protein